jgi:RHS repeat-associated protein
MPGRSSSSSTPDDDYKFTGHQRDAELDLDYMLARNYDPLIGRFMQVDPHYFNYSDISPYIYVGNNPLSFIDPTGRDWYDINGSIVWFDQSGTLEIEFDGKMETYESLGKNVLVSYHNRDSDGNEEINTAIHMLYLESNTFNASARIEGNTIPANILTMNTLAEGIYPAREQARSRYNGERALIINNGLNVSNTKGGTMNEIFFHRGNTGRPSLITGQGINISEGCIVGPSCSGSLPRFNAFMQYLKEYNGNLYLRSNRVKR